MSRIQSDRAFDESGFNGLRDCRYFIAISQVNHVDASFDASKGDFLRVDKVCVLNDQVGCIAADHLHFSRVVELDSLVVAGGEAERVSDW